MDKLDISVIGAMIRNLLIAGAPPEIDRTRRRSR